MVGIAGRSKGCRTCRRRRIKCDEGKPHCDRCRKRGFQCDGYVQYSEFHDETKRFKSLQASLAPDQLIEKKNEEILSLTNLPWDEDSIFTSHLVSKLFAQIDDESSHLASWMSSHINQPNNTSLSIISLRALSTIYFGKVHGQSDLLRKGTKLYSDALNGLQVQLRHPQHVLDSDIVAVIICLAIYESVAFTQPNAWLQHYKGLASLTALRGPERHQDGVGFALLPTLRSTIAMGFIVNRKRCFLEEPMWKTIPWAKRPDSKTFIDYLHDIFCDIPALLEGVDGLLESDYGVEYETAKAGLCQKALSLLEDLYAWRWKWQDAFPDASYIVSADADLLPSNPARPFKSVIWFKNYSRASELCLYDAMLLIIVKMCEILDIHLEPISSEYINDPLLPMDGTSRDIAFEILRMVDYHLHCLQGSSGAFMLIFPLNVARRNLDLEQIAWLDQIMAQIADTHGFEMGRANNIHHKTD